MNQDFGLGAGTALVFGTTQFRLIDHKGTVWVRGLQIGQALGYANPSVAIYNLYNRNADEFSDEMTMVLPLTAGGDLDNQPGYPGGGLDNQPDDAGQTREVRLFSARGAHLLGMLARTQRAAEFRRWVLDVLETACAAAAFEKLTLAQELACIGKSVWLMERIRVCTSLQLAEELYLRLMRVNRRLGMQTMAFSALAVSWRQGELPLGGAGEDRTPGQH